MKMKNIIRMCMRRYHSPHNGFGKSFPREDNIFGEVQDALTTQRNIKKMVITINNPIYVSKDSIEYNTPYTVDMHYSHKRYLHTLESSECESIVRQAIGWIYNQPEEPN